jgi:hypothetical protein
MVSALFCSFDSFLASLSIGLFGCSESSRRRLILAFGAFDLGATLVGTSIRSVLGRIHGGGLTSCLVTIVTVAVAVAVLIYYERRNPVTFLWVPVLLCLDNFIASLLDGSNHVTQSPLIAGLASSLAAWTGFIASWHAGALFSRRVTVMVSVTLLLIFVLVN